MCRAAISWSRMEQIFYSGTAADAAAAGFDDAFLYDELRKSLGKRKIPEQRLLAERATESFDAWRTHMTRVHY